MKPIEVVTWVDSAGPDSWTSTLDAVAERVSVITSVGFVIFEDEEQLTLCGGIDSKHSDRHLEMVHKVICIPKVAIRSRLVISAND